MLEVVIVSDATAETAERLARAALAQFSSVPIKLTRRNAVRSARKIRKIVHEAADGNAIILHTLASNELRTLILSESRLHDVDSLDLMGPLLEHLATRLGLSPREQPGLLEQLTVTKSRQIDAVGFAFRHDDGQNAEDLGQAEVVLVGISRTMKTPVMLYLAYRGWFAANVPIVLDLDLPRALFMVRPERVFCLLMGESQLRQLRCVRAGEESIPMEPYASKNYIRKELLYSRELTQKFGWRIISVGGKSVEEVSREIIALLPSEEHTDS